MTFSDPPEGPAGWVCTCGHAEEDAIKLAWPNPEADGDDIPEEMNPPGDA